MPTEMIYQWSGRAGLAFLVLLVSVVAGWLLARILKRVARHKSLQSNRIYRLIGGSVSTIIVMAGAVSALGTLGVNVTAMVAAMGLTGFGVGIALKDAVSNLVAGVLIVIYKPFDLGDRITCSGVEGEVLDINLRYVTVKNDEGAETMIPNSNFVTNIIRKRAEQKAAEAAAGAPTEAPAGDGAKAGDDTKAAAAADAARGQDI